MVILQPQRPEPARIHVFKTDLQFSEEARLEPFWLAVYRRAFPNLVNCMPCPGDHQSQRQGIDRVLLLANGQILKVDEKARREAWDDMLLELVSNDKTGAPGWIEKDLAIDYLAYGIVPTKKCHLFPFPLLRQAWRENGGYWKRHFPIKPSKNVGYNTINLFVPMGTVKNAVMKSMYVDVSADLPDVCEDGAEEEIPF